MLLHKTLRLIPLALSALIAASAQAAPEQPNVIVMVADDLGWADVGFHGAPIETPALDRLADEGAELGRFYTAPTCSPTRAALMTGRDPIRLGIVYATIMPWSNNGVHPDETMMPEAFSAAGYQTAMVGKWHLGHAQETFTPNSRGFDHFYGHLHTEVGYFPPFENQGGRDFQRNGVTIDDQGYETYLLAAEANRWIENRDKTKPFFLYLPFLAPHTPVEAPEALIKKYEGLNDNTEKSRSKNSDRTQMLAAITMQDNPRPIYAAMVDAMDQSINKILDTLDKEGIADNTIVMFFSDNGGATYAGAGAYNFPLRGGKGDTFEGGIRVPTVIRWPEKIKPGTEVNSIITVMDVFPTLAAASSVETNTHFKLDGRNMLPAITEGKTIMLDDTVKFASETPIRGSVSATAFNEKWKLVQQIEQGLLSADVTNYLFHIEDDPYEHNNLAEANPDVVQELAADIHEWRMLYPVNGTRSNLVPPPGWRAPKDWVSYPNATADLQADTARGMPPKHALRSLDMMHGENGRLIYDCVPKRWLLGICRPNS
ncbi:Arylsulfatase [Sinobacterium norvegicum]|uniref:Arylsulfatase n=1 Tax=Sinobacterium norvegicum TaxID=1641715 RepID=A0ABN8ERZ3_9GAMM|nr:sulfatase-like hydrolase/transferase [Sinobacterium norvegicum]CAH0993056.1 Arylsulfatase [Sinobacterium norvegicum]